jgi:hypothetical protein
MRQGRCNKDIFWAPKDGEIICAGAGSRTDITDGMTCSVSCKSSIADPPEITCTNVGWDYAEATCDATNGNIRPGGQIAFILLGLVLLCVGTFLWHRHRSKQTEDEEKQNPDKKQAVIDIPKQYQDMSKLGPQVYTQSSPLPEPKKRPANGYHPAGKGIHNFMGTTTIGTISQYGTQTS